MPASRLRNHKLSRVDFMALSANRLCNFLRIYGFGSFADVGARNGVISFVPESGDRMITITRSLSAPAVNRAAPYQFLQNDSARRHALSHKPAHYLTYVSQTN